MADTNTEVMNQERQKTVIAFVAGLLIGGLLVWVFSSAGGTGGKVSDDAMQDTDVTNDGGSMDNTANDALTDSSSNTSSGATDSTMSKKGYLEVNDQAPGGSVAINDVTFPTTAGWIVVRDYANGQGGRILGAARYDTTVGLTPSNVVLVRDTEAGGIYLVQFYSENGDLKFDTTADQPIAGTASAAFNVN